MSADPTQQGTGRTVASYVLEEEIGRGGMGVVYRARKLDTGETVAVKLMLPELAANPRFRERFVREASLMPELDHPNIVPIYDVGDSDGELYVAMKLVEGKDLKALIEAEGPLSTRRIRSILRQAADALDAAHEAGVVHHDVKPQNILIATAESSQRDLVFLTDFGLVRPAGSESTSSRTGHVFGSIQYMSPEQVEGMATDGRADVYGLACVLYECLTGQIPFDRPNEVAVLWAHVHEEATRVTDLRPELPGGVDEVLAMGMSKHPDDRYLTAGELVDAFDEGLKKTHRSLVLPAVRPLVKRIPRMKTAREVWAPNYFPELARVKKESERVNWLQVTGSISIICLLAAALVHFAHPGGVAGAASDVATAVSDTVKAAGNGISAAFDSDERAVPDSDGGVATVDRSQQNAFNQGSTKVITRTVTERSKPQVVTTVPAEDNGPSPAVPKVTSTGPISRSFAFVSTRDGSFDIYAGKVGSKSVRQLTSGAMTEFDPVYSPDGERIAFSRGAFRDSVLDCPTARECPYDSYIYVMEADGENVTRLSVGTDVYDRDPTWSPDGKSIVFTRWNEGGNSDLMILTQDSQGSWTQSVLTDAPGSEIEAQFSPDGSRIVYSADLDSDTTWTQDESHVWDLFLMDGSSTITRLTRDQGADSPIWSPDGKQIAYAGRDGIYVMNPDGGGKQRVTTGPDNYLDWSPDGRRLAFQRCASLLEKCRVLTFTLASGKTSVGADDVGDYDGMPAWSPSDR